MNCLHSRRKQRKQECLYALYLYYCYELHIIVHKPASIKKVSVFLREDVTKLDQYIAQADFLGREKFIVSSDTTENELWMKYPEIMKALSPYMFCNAACGDIYAESLKNINKFRKRSSNTIDFGAIEVLEDQMDIEAPELGIRLILSEGLSVCTPLQRERIQKYYIEGMSLSEIAEGKNISTVQQSIDAGIKKMKNFFGVDP